MKKLYSAALLTLLFCYGAHAATIGGVKGVWRGKLNLGSASLHIVFHLSRMQDGGYAATMDSPDQGASDIGCDSVRLHNDSLFIHIAAIHGSYTGRLANDSEIDGNWMQNGYMLPLKLLKSKGEEPAPAELNTDSNCNETAITLHTPTGDIFGTLCTPKGFTKGPVALIIAGSGPTDRNCNGPLLKTDAYKILAHELSDSGIASVRYDKRGIAQSNKAMPDEAALRFGDLIDDAEGWIRLLKADSRFTQVAIIGHSEGSLIGMVAARSAGAVEFISIAGAGETIDKILKRQLQNLSGGKRDTAYSIIDSLAAGHTVSNVPPAFYPLARKSVQPYLISWMKYNPAVEIHNLAMPVLIIQGTNDLQVTVQDAKELSEADKNAKLVLLDKMNHIFRDVDGGKQANLATYNNPLLPIDNKLVSNICDFINKK